MTGLGRPLQVTDPSGKMFVLIKDQAAQIPVAFGLLASRAPHKVVLRVSGGCKGMGAQDKIQMLEFFSDALDGYRGMIWSGGTRQLDADGQIDPMVTDVPSLLARRNPDCVALGSCPRTNLLRLQGDSQLSLDDWGTRPNPGLAALLIVQDGAEGNLDWDGDLNDAFSFMTSLRAYGGFSQAGLIAWNGGPVTQKEIVRSAGLGWPTFLVKGSGRVADEIVARIESGDAEYQNQFRSVVIINKNDPKGFRESLREQNFLV